MKRYMMMIAFGLFVIVSCFANTGFSSAFVDTLKYKWHTPTDRYDFRDNLDLRNSILPDFQKEMINVSSNMERSLFLPGIGHFHTGNYLRGLLMVGSEVFIASTAIYMYDKGKQSYKKYKVATQIDDINRYYDSAVTNYTQASMMVGLFVAVWVYNIYDTYLVTTAYNEKLWNEHLRKERERRFYLTPAGATFRF